MSMKDWFKSEPQPLVVDPSQRMVKADQGRNVYAPGHQPADPGLPVMPGRAGAKAARAFAAATTPSEGRRGAHPQDLLLAVGIPVCLFLGLLGQLGITTRRPWVCSRRLTDRDSPCCNPEWQSQPNPLEVRQLWCST